MENYQGDLTDIVRGSAVSDVSGWRFPSDSSSPSCSTTVVDGSFGDPFSAMSDPLLQEPELPLDASYIIAPAPDIFCGETMLGGHYETPCNILSRIQISSSGSQMGCDSPSGVKSPPVINGNSSSSSSKGCLSTDGASQLQISSPRNLGIKRRKNQAKKVVCIPAPAAANSRSSGEVVPSDLWAWRKYGQKPIKGSPYPRGYYRCSSSKGCSARKQVERSRTDPNMLVITYTSEHNHPWPTQRNALAGSTRSQPSKGTKKGDEAAGKDDESSSDGAADLSPTVKEELAGDHETQTMEVGADQVYRPEMSCDHQEDLFAGLDEIEVNDLLFIADDADDEAKAQKGVVDPFSIFDWSGQFQIKSRSLSPP